MEKSRFDHNAGQSLSRTPSSRHWWPDIFSSSRTCLEKRWRMDLLCSGAPSSPSSSSGFGTLCWKNLPSIILFFQVSNGYFITDMAMLLKYYPNLGEIEFVVHHAVSIISLFLAVHSGYAHIYLYTVLLSESTTPFINIRWYLAAADMKKTRAYTINGIALFVSWLIARIVLFVYLFAHMYWHYDEVFRVASKFLH
ncbi:transmembrane protein 56 [Selaginella moellendorffii]|uniref:transmembrane protein 56 n=1 Tax=Selaginella moellendorffii TaxID=88036 RepID=UPI000D1C408B|nr:transmembrane protein 56 [Selaginella moellendorffii]|eukprot:XP_024526519.1 transmembrane protein 56 [Selaginella moellendorffii]